MAGASCAAANPERLAGPRDLLRLAAHVSCGELPLELHQPRRFCTGLPLCSLLPILDDR